MCLPLNTDTSSISLYGRNVDSWAVSLVEVKQPGVTEVRLTLPLQDLPLSFKSFSSLCRANQVCFPLKDIMFSVELQR